MDNPLKKSFPLELKEDGGGDDGCGCGNDKPSQNLREAFNQEEGATRFLKEQSDPFTEEEGEDELPDEMKDQQFGDEDEDEEEMEESRGAVEDVLADINGYSRNEDDGMDEVLAGVLNDINEDSDSVAAPYEKQGEPESTMSHGGEEDEEELPDAERKDEIDEVLAEILDEDEQQALNEEDPCWEGYTMVGKKMQDGEEVPNCVPEEDAEDYEANESVEGGPGRPPREEGGGSDVGGVDILDAVLEDQVDELSKLDQLAEEVLNG